MQPIDDMAQAQQPSPFQAALERAIMQEMGRPQGQWMPQVSEMRRMQAEPRLNHRGLPDISQPERLTYAEPSQFGHMLAAGAQQSASMNDMQGRRLGVLMAGRGQDASAAAQMMQGNAQMMQAQTGADELAYKRSPEGQAFAFKMAGLPEQTAQSVIQKGIGLQPGVPLPANLDEAFQKRVDSGRPPIDPGSSEYQAWLDQYGLPAIEGRMAGKPSGVGEHIASYLPPLSSFASTLRGLGIDTGKRTDVARKAIGVGAPKGESAVSPGVQQQMKAKHEDRKQGYNKFTADR